MRILEVGFNAGHSSYTFLNARPDTQVVSFDLGDHAYGLRARQFIGDRFPERHMLIVGDSRSTLPQYIAEKPAPFDLILIDGGHTYEVAKSDLECLRALATPETILVMDDLVPDLPWGVGPTRVWKEALAAGSIQADFYLRNGSRTSELNGWGRDRVCGVGRYL